MLRRTALATRALSGFEAFCSGRVRGIETGFSFETNVLTANDFFAEIGQERNGIFLR